VLAGAKGWTKQVDKIKSVTLQNVPPVLFFPELYSTRHTMCFSGTLFILQPDIGAEWIIAPKGELHH
jgi:hypothetical protein